MTWRFQKSLLAFRRGDDGNATVEFAVTFPVLLIILLTTVELGLVTLRQSQLERALDQTVRDLRLSTGANLQHDEIRDRICSRSGFIDDCATSLRLEMIQLNPFIWASGTATTAEDGSTGFHTIPTEGDCIDQVEDVQPVRNFINGQSNELMFIRACMKFSPVFPAWGLGKGLEKDADGRVSLFASSAFVQEPN
ncbi:TadE/TadG family type IV pilus assembly protein [Roseobacteraceae bacterium NS-SX3]